MNNKYKAQIDSVLHYINQQILKDWSDMASDAFNKAIQGDILAKEACMSSRNFQLYFKLYLKESFGEYVDRVRRELALQSIPEGYELSDGLILEHYLDSADMPESNHQTEVWIPINKE